MAIASCWVEMEIKQFAKRKRWRYASPSKHYEDDRPQIYALSDIHFFFEHFHSEKTTAEIQR